MSKEHAIQNDIRNDLVNDCLLFRANVGTGWQGVGKPYRVQKTQTVIMQQGDVLLRQARPFSTGLPEGFSDLFGLVPITITPDMVGRTVAVFIALEVKKPGERPKTHQAAFIKAVNDNGGHADAVRSVDDARAVVARAKGK